MNWKSWKLGLFVAALTGLASCAATFVAVPGATWRELLCLFGAFIAKDILLFLKDHPASIVTFDSTVTETTPQGESVTKTHISSETQPQPKG